MRTRKRWQDWLNLALGVWLLLAPFIIHESGTSDVAAWNSYVCGGAVALLAAVALVQPVAWEEWINLAIGLWLTVAPWLLDFAAPAENAAANQLIVGTVIAATALWGAVRAHQPRRNY
jgi:hypothetical protein